MLRRMASEKERMCVCVCVDERVRERECVCVCLCGSVIELERERVHSGRIIDMDPMGVRKDWVRVWRERKKKIRRLLVQHPTSYYHFLPLRKTVYPVEARPLKIKMLQKSRRLQNSHSWSLIFDAVLMFQSHIHLRKMTIVWACKNCICLVHLKVYFHVTLRNAQPEIWCIFRVGAKKWNRTFKWTFGLNFKKCIFTKKQLYFLWKNLNFCIAQIKYEILFEITTSSLMELLI